MRSRRTIVVLSMLCAFAACAFAAPNALAIKGTTLFTCKSVETGAEFGDEHCNKSGTGKGFIHTPVNEGETTTTEGTNEKTSVDTKSATNAVLNGTLNGAAFQLVCTTVTSSGTLTNKVGGGQMFFEGTDVIKHTGCKVELPAGTGCKVKNGEFLIEATVVSVVKVNGMGTEEMYVEYRPKKEKNRLGEFTLQECVKGLVDGVYFLEGTAIATPNGATWEFIEKEPNSTLTLGGKEAKYKAEETLKRKLGNPLTVTTTTT